jgi:hypothetical protein
MAVHGSCGLLALFLMAGLLGRGAGQVYDPMLDEEGDWADDMGYQSDPAYEQYAERLQQQLESLRKEHDEIFGRADTNKVRRRTWMLGVQCCAGAARSWPQPEGAPCRICAVYSRNRSGMLTLAPACVYAACLVFNVVCRMGQ